jgi:glutamate dehydrogenase/leucine dehydrogenase
MPMDDVLQYADTLGPEKVYHLYQPALELKAIVVVDNTAAGPAIGGTRMAPDVTLEECARLARAMTLKNAAAGLPHGGAKSVIMADSGMPVKDKEQIVRAFAQAIREIEDYIPGPDIGTNEVSMAWIKNEIGRAVGLPRVVGGIPLDEIGATGFGLAAAAVAAEDFGGPSIEGARVAVQGFGAVGVHVARFLAQKGAKLVAASDSRATITDPEGLDIAPLISLKQEGQPLSAYGRATVSGRDAIVGVPCDIWIPAARPDVLRTENVDQLDAKLLLQGANIPATADAERRLHERGILSIPDFIANAGGVICAAVEYRGGTQSDAFNEIAEKITANTRATLELASAESLLPREAAARLARQRVEQAMALRRWK